MPISNRPWSDISESDYADAGDYCAASLIDLNEGSDKSKGLCKLPVREPRSMGGALNRNGVHAAYNALAGGRGGVQASPDVKRKAARRLLSLYRELNEEPPEGLRRLASG